MAGKLKVIGGEEVKQMSPILMTVYQLLIEKTMFEKQHQNENNRTVLGGVGFYFKENGDEYYLCYDKHPKYWNEVYIKEDIEEIKKYMMIEKGAYIEQ